MPVKELLRKFLSSTYDADPDPDLKLASSGAWVVGFLAALIVLDRVPPDQVRGAVNVLSTQVKELAVELDLAPGEANDQQA